MQFTKLNTLFLSKIFSIAFLGAFLLTQPIYGCDDLDQSLRDTLPKNIYPYVHQYLTSLPKLLCNDFDSTAEKSQKMVDFFIEFSPQRHNKKDSNFSGKENLALKIQSFLERDTPISMIIIGFPSKSTNTESKVMSSKFDMGDFFGLLTCDYMCREIEKVHSKGAMLTIYSDGRLYNDILGISDEVFNTYQNSLQRFIALFNPRLRLGDSQKITDALDGQDSDIDEHTLTDIKIFLKEELNCKHHKDRLKEKYPKMGFKKSIKHEQNDLGRNIAKISAQFSKGVQSATNNYSGLLRLSVHPHENIDEKCGISLVYESMGTPWHRTPVLGDSDHGLMLIKRKDFMKKFNKETEPAPRTCTIHGVELSYYQGEGN